MCRLDQLASKVDRLEKAQESSTPRQLHSRKNDGSKSPVFKRGAHASAISQDRGNKPNTTTANHDNNKQVAVRPHFQVAKQASPQFTSSEQEAQAASDQLGLAPQQPGNNHVDFNVCFEFTSFLTLIVSFQDTQLTNSHILWEARAYIRVKQQFISD